MVCLPAHVLVVLLNLGRTELPDSRLQRQVVGLGHRGGDGGGGVQRLSGGGGSWAGAEGGQVLGDAGEPDHGVCAAEARGAGRGGGRERKRRSILFASVRCWPAANATMQRRSAPPAFAHIGPAGVAEPFGPADNALIAAAQARGDQAVRIGDVHLPSGAVLRFEVRFGENARSRFYPDGIPGYSMCQVNLRNENTRPVSHFEGAAAPALQAPSSPVGAAPATYHPPPSSGGPPVYRPPPGPGPPKYLPPSAGGGGGPPVYRPPPGPGPQPDRAVSPQRAFAPPPPSSHPATFAHINPRGAPEPFSVSPQAISSCRCVWLMALFFLTDCLWLQTADNALIAAALARGEPSTRLADV